MERVAGPRGALAASGERWASVTRRLFPREEPGEDSGAMAFSLGSVAWALGRRLESLTWPRTPKRS